MPQTEQHIFLELFRTRRTQRRDGLQACPRSRGKESSTPPSSVQVLICAPHVHFVHVGAVALCSVHVFGADPLFHVVGAVALCVRFTCLELILCFTWLELLLCVFGSR